MEDIIIQILDLLREGQVVDDQVLVKLIHAAAKRAGGDKRAFAKRRLLPFYQSVKRDDPKRWASWDVTPELEGRLLHVLRMKPRRSASGVATITVITKPWPCGGTCVFCPNDLRMPKSYLADEPACARAEQSCFDPYLQVSARLTALSQMGHATDKIELIVLGGTWSDYPVAYQTWFMKELFRALNDDAVSGVAANPLLRGFPGDTANDSSSLDAMPVAVRERRDQLASCGLADPNCAEGRPMAQATPELEAVQAEVDAGHMTYNEAFHRLYDASDPWQHVASRQRASLDDLEREQRRNETARHRVVGLVIETRPDAIAPERLRLIRRMGATKIQMGVQSTDEWILARNGRAMGTEAIARAFSLLRLFGFKIHAHAMVNLLGATPDADKADYRRLMESPAYRPDEVKLYPCALIGGTELCRFYHEGQWQPYSEEELLDVLTSDVLATPPFTRVSRMIRDFSTQDIVAGNKKPNLRQMVEQRLEGQVVQEIRMREISTSAVDLADLRLDVVAYKTATTEERFLQWVTHQNRIAGFLRLSLPHADALAALGNDAPVGPGEAMIREVHVYGMATPVGSDGPAAQHHGLGKRLVERACAIACDAGYECINVISAVGTREYYRSLGFADHGLYQQRRLS
ncbi:tRNA uridine(34) 5-carboxymethylaminomethyl modification radical SAM/GNAT enzyme Elp3 [Collinsella sp. An2]|uniref:elongator complex protein 3 n=1 Tax=Collinsella sp. An2 TaxID=1965585 RepID=UPI000B3AB163|nr:tRNA uridine(34) 5-carboxymethylaminomethyl modification radical SAM/GNAT enzyme Elp3 [Collinsella sp. An2]OUP07709.1 histone acetyltransferase [Collinsella sp. An2]